MSAYRMLVLDLDGTALAGGGELLERDVRAALALREAGVHVTVCTGRLFTGSQWVAAALGVQGTIAVVNGSEIIDAQTGETVHGTYLDRASRHRARAILAERDLSTFLFGSRCIHYSHADAHHAPYLGIWTPHLQVHDDVHTAPHWDDGDDIVAVCAVGEAAAIDGARAHLHAELPRELGTFRFQTFDGAAFLKVRHHGEDKGSALARLAQARGCTAAETVAVGDWLNDLPMLRAAGRSFAMGHACEEVRSAANEVLEASRHTGGAVAEVAARVWGVEV